MNYISGRLKWPLNWESACKNAEKADVILCLGSSLKVLKKYPWLWQMDRPKNKRPKIYIVNLQWTPKDKNASLKINGKCDEVMEMVMNFMNIKVSPYNRKKDPIFAHASLLLREEMHTVSQPMLKHHKETDKQVAVNENGVSSTLDVKEELSDTHKFDANGIKVEDADEADEINPNETKNKTSQSCQEIAMEQAKPLNIENSGEIERKDCSIVNDTDDDDMKLPPSSHIEDSAKPQTTSHEISTQPHDNNHLNGIAGKLELIHNGKTHKMDAEKCVSHQIKQENVHQKDEKDEEGKMPKIIPKLDIIKHFTVSGYFKSLINYYRAIEGVVPHWYDVNYAYSGLHSIINPPPNEVDIWSTIIIPIFQLNRNLAECEFCFDNYAEDKCQFYKPLLEFHVSVTPRRSGKRILCECCDDYDDDEEQTSLDEIDGSEETKTNSEEDDTDSSRSKRLKLEQIDCVKVTTRVVQPGWYGKGYRKTTKRKKTRRSQLR